jgi:DNA topoisomerase-1
VDQVSRRLVKLAPPTPFNIGDLQREAYRAFGFSPSLTLRIAERLYLDALISYPRTSSQKLPPSIDYPKILRGLGRLAPYRQLVQELLAGPLKPREGAKDDPAHPAIYPTGEVPQRELDSRESKLYDLIVRRFFAVFGEEAHQERVRAHILVEGYGFKLAGRRTVKEGWLRYYGLYSGVEEAPIPPLEEGDRLQVVSIDVLEKFERPPPRYNQSSLLQKMEEEGIGTKTTRADIIKTLYDRGYVVGESMEVTDMGFKVVELMKRHSSIIVSTEMTRAIERDLEAIEQGTIRGEEVVERAILSLAEALPQIKGLEVEIGREIRKAVISTVRAQNLLGPCPVCGTGNLTIIRSIRSRKRFVGCTNYSKGCRASAPLPQRGSIKATGKACPHCNWPIIDVFTGRGRPWRLCVNPKCPGKKAREERPSKPEPAVVREEG